MCIQPFKLGKFLHGGQRSLERVASVFDDARAPLELIDREASEGRARAACRQRVARPGDVIAQHRRRISAEKNCARGQNLFGNFARVARHHFAMLRRELVCERDGVGQRLHLNQIAVVVQRALDELAPREFGQLPGDFFFDGF